MPLGSDGQRPNRETDAELARRMAAGDQSAWQLFHDLYFQVLLGLARQLVGDVETASDLVQDCYIRLMDSIGRYDQSRATLKTYSCLILRRLCIDYLRSSGARPTSAGRDDDRSNDSGPRHPGPGPLAQAMGRDERRMIARSLRAISGRLSARTVRLVYLRGWSIAMVAARHRCTTSAAKVRLCRGRAAFREALAKLAPESVPGRRAQTRKPDQKPPRELIGSVTLGRLGSYIFRLYYAGQVTLRKIERAFRKRLGVHKRSVVGALRRARAAVLELLEENGQLVQYLVRRARERLGLDTAISRKCVLRQFALEMGEVRPLGWA